MSGTTTVVFTDLTGSTSVTASLGDDAYAAAFTAHLALLRAETVDNNGRIAKVLGDGVMALFDSAYNGVRAAVGMQQAVERADRHHRGVPFMLRVGLNVGEIVDTDDDVFGMSLIVAKRLCDAAPPAQVYASDLVRQLVGHRTDVEFEAVDPLALKGVDGMTAAWRVPWSPRPDEPSHRVIVADDAGLIRAGIVRLLTDGGFVVTADVGDLDSLIAAVDADPPDLVVTDIRMPPTNTDEGLRATATIRARHPDTAVLVLSQYIDAGAATLILEHGATGVGYLLKERVTDLTEFLAAAREIAGGGSVIDPLVSEQLMRRRRDNDVVARLSDRERDVLRLMAGGKSNAAIGDELAMATKTVETHVRSIFQKLDLEVHADDHRRVLAVVRWLQQPD